MLQSFPGLGSVDVRQTSCMKKWIANTQKQKILTALVVGGLLALLAGVIVFLYLQTRIREPGLDVPPAREEIKIEPLVSKPDNPVQKRLGGDKLSYLYELNGSFAEALVLDERKENSVLRGRFTLSGDPLGREIAVVTGVGGRKTLFGTFEGSLRGNSKWTMVENVQVAVEIKPGELVRLVVDYRLSQADAVPEYFSKTQNIMDSLAEEFNNNNFRLIIPENFYLIAEGVGVVR